MECVRTDVTVACHVTERVNLDFNLRFLIVLGLNTLRLYQMPGPSNSSVRRKRKSRGKENNKGQSGVPDQPHLNQDSPTTNKVQEPPADHDSCPPSPPSPPYLRTPSPFPYQLQNSKEGSLSLDEHVPRAVEEVLFKQPFIHDPGNGPRVRIARDFISSFFAQPPAFDVSSIVALSCLK